MKNTGQSVSWMHRFASLAAVSLFLLILMKAMISLPVGAADAPLRYGREYRIAAVVACFMVLLLCAWLWKSAAAKYIKALALITLGALVVNLFTGAIPLPGDAAAGPSLAGDLGIQGLFCLTVCLALFTRDDWRWDHLKSPDVASPSVRQVLVFTSAAVFLESILGGVAGYKQMRLAPHVVLGVIVTACALWVLELALTKFSHLQSFKLSAIFLAEVVGLELFLGVVSYSMELNARAAAVSQPGAAIMRVTHAAVGELALAVSLFAVFQAFKYVASYVASEEAVAEVMEFSENQEVTTSE